MAWTVPRQVEQAIVASSFWRGKTPQRDDDARDGADFGELGSLAVSSWWQL
jgi:hypothetical protein